MGSGGGEFYDRDTKDGYTRSSAGYSADAAKQLSRAKLDASLLPKNRKLVCTARSPVVYAFDDTGSMGSLPKIIFDKMPLVAGQIAENNYLDDPQMSVAAVGDIVGDDAPLQIGDFSQLRKLDDWLKRIWLEGGGGDGYFESYEMIAYYYARMCELPKAQTPFLLITGDEGFRETLYKSDLERHFGGEHAEISAAKVFDELKKKFKGNVFLIHRQYKDPGADERIIAQWEKVLGRERVLHLGSDESIADVTLGLFAVMSGNRTLEEYLDDMTTKRQVAQTKARVAEVRRSLEVIVTLAPKKKVPQPKTGGKKKKDTKKDVGKKPDRL